MTVWVVMDSGDGASNPVFTVWKVRSGHVVPGLNERLNANTPEYWIQCFH